MAPCVPATSKPRATKYLGPERPRPTGPSVLCAPNVAKADPELPLNHRHRPG